MKIAAFKLKIKLWFIQNKARSLLNKIQRLEKEQTWLTPFFVGPTASAIKLESNRKELGKTKEEFSRVKAFLEL